MLHRRLLDALDSSASLLFIEAIDGSGKRTLLRQWEDRGGSRHGEIRLRFNARRLPTDPAILTRMFWSALGHRLEQELPELPEDDALLEEAVLRVMQQIRRPIVVAIHGIDYFDAAAFTVVLRLLVVGVRLLIAGNDVTDLVRMVQQRGIYYSTLGDREVWFSLAETREVVEEQGADLTEDALAALHHATLGHPGMIVNSLATMPIETAHAVLTRDRAIAAFLVEEPLDRWPSAFADFLGVVVNLPRFTPAEAAVLAPRDGVSQYLSRLLGLSVGRMVWHPGLQERVFRWDERVRQVMLSSMPPRAVGEASSATQVIAAARACGDEELLVSVLVWAGELDQAEELLREKIWDVLPNAMAPLWSALERLSPLALVGRPALLSARLRLSPRRSRSPVSARAARRAGRLMADAADADSPWARMGNLAYAIEFALYAGERERLIDLFSRVRVLIADLVASEAAERAGGKQVSELLLIAETVFRSGNTIPAAEIARFAAPLMEIDPVRLDPRGERVAFARRLILHDHRARGLEDVFDPEVLLAGSQFLWRDGDIAVAAMTLMWGDLDDGDLLAADAHLRAAASRVADPEAWPILMLIRANIAVYRQSPGELEAAVSAYERGTLSEPGPFAQQSLSQVGRTTDFLSRKVGRPVASPGYLPATPEPGHLFYPRIEFVVYLMEALYALRAESPAGVRKALAQAIALSPRREIGLYTLTTASDDEVKGLRRIAEGMPGGSRLRLEKALLLAGSIHNSSIDLSDREREVLGHLRDGATNPEMAQAMFVSVNTVKFHRANLMRKLDVTSRERLLTAADSLGL